MFRKKLIKKYKAYRNILLEMKPKEEVIIKTNQKVKKLGTHPLAK